MVKRTTAAALALSLLILCGSGTALAAVPDTDSAGLVISDFSEYQNNEAFVCYADGSFEVLAYENADALADGLGALEVLGGSDGGGTTASIIEAIRYAQANGAAICNLSLGSSFNDRALYQAVAASPMLFVAAAGNDGEIPGLL